jgi:hypothetical protein
MTRIAYDIKQAAEQVSVSVDTIRRAIRATDPGAYPPPLKAKQTGSDKKPAYRILHADLEAWASSLKDA